MRKSRLREAAFRSVLLRLFFIKFYPEATVSC